MLPKPANKSNDSVTVQVGWLEVEFLVDRDMILRLPEFDDKTFRIYLQLLRGKYEVENEHWERILDVYFLIDYIQAPSARCLEILTTICNQRGLSVSDIPLIYNRTLAGSPLRQLCLEWVIRHPEILEPRQIDFTTEFLDELTAAKFKKCLTEVFIQSKYRRSDPWQYDADLFPHVGHISHKASPDKYVALPSVSVSGVYHVVGLYASAVGDLVVAYIGCYHECYIDPDHPALWKDEAISWSRNLPKPKPLRGGNCFKDMSDLEAEEYDACRMQRVHFDKKLPSEGKGFAWRISGGGLVYVTEAQATDKASDLNWTVDVEKYEREIKNRFLPVALDETVPSPGKKFMWSLSGDHRGYYYPTEEGAKEMATYYERVIEKFEVDANCNEYSAI